MRTEFVVIVVVLLIAAYMQRCRPCSISMEGI